MGAKEITYSEVWILVLADIVVLVNSFLQPLDLLVNLIDFEVKVLAEFLHHVEGLLLDLLVGRCYECCGVIFVHELLY